MSATPDDIQQQQTLLATHRRTLATLLTQQAALGSAFAPPGVAHGIAEARAGIARCKAALRGWGMAVDDHPDDAETAVGAASAPAGAGDTINAQGSQGFVNRPAGPIYQHFGDIVGGDKVSGDITVSDVSGTGIAIGHKSQAQVQVQVQQGGAMSSTDDQSRDDAPAAPQRLRVFLCHAHEDRAVVLPLYQRLREEGCQPWMDKMNLLPGQEWQTEIQKAVRESDVFLVCVSRHSATKAGFINREIAFALDVADEQPSGTIFVIPVRLEDSAVPERLSRWHWCNYFEDDGYDTLVQALRVRARQLGRAIAPVPVPAPVPPKPVAPAPTPLVSARYDGIPITVDEWRYELMQRNEIFGKPAGYWCYVRPGTYKIGGWEENEASANIVLRGFWIAKYPVTVAQYAAFIEAGGYNNQRWWTPNGWAWKQEKNRTQPWGWGDSKYNGRTQPVIGVRWYEAVALAAWLHEQVQPALPEGYRVRLPTEAEWEAAAAYDERMQRRTYPWGEQKPTQEHAVCQQGGGFVSAVKNFFGGTDKPYKPDKPAPVGGRLAGAAACGALDMAGNVWEPTMSNGDGYPGKSAVVVSDIEEDSWDVPWRGGAYYSGSTGVRCAARIRGAPRLRLRRQWGAAVRLPSHT